MAKLLDLPHCLPAEIEGRAGDSPSMLTALRNLARTMMEVTKAAKGSLDTSKNHYEDGKQHCGRDASAIYLNRANRDNFFPSKLFGEPAWDILLDLFAAAKANELRSVKAVCLASRVPEATALRHIAQLRDAGLIEQKLDKTDGRRKFLMLTTSGIQRMEAYIILLIPVGDQAQDLVRFLATGD